MIKRYIGVVFALTLIIGVISWSTRHDPQETLVTVLITAVCATGGVALAAWAKRGTQQQPTKQ